MNNNRIKILRNSLGMNQEEFADRIGLNRSTISLIEQGKRNLTRQSRMTILREFNVNPEWLDEGIGTMFNSFESKNDMMDFLLTVSKTDDNDIRKKIIKILSKLEPKHWEELADLLDTIKKQ